jgi:hypothetical protein
VQRNAFVILHPSSSFVKLSFCSNATSTLEVLLQLHQGENDVDVETGRKCYKTCIKLCSPRANEIPIPINSKNKKANQVRDLTLIQLTSTETQDKKEE